MTNARDSVDSRAHFITGKFDLKSLVNTISHIARSHAYFFTCKVVSCDKSGKHGNMFYMIVGTNFLLGNNGERIHM